MSACRTPGTTRTPIARSSATAAATAKRGIGWYRKHFKLPASAEGRKVFLEFEGLRQAGHFFLNGQPIGIYENGITAFGLDITKLVKFGGQDNVLAVKVDNSTNYKEEATGTAFEWKEGHQPEFRRAEPRCLADRHGQGLPDPAALRESQDDRRLRLSANYRHEEQDRRRQCRGPGRNETGDYAAITLSAVVVDADGIVRAKFDGDASDLVGGQTETFTAAGPLAGARFWDMNDPYLYDVYSILSVNGKVVDVCKTHTGFRKAEFKGGAGTGGVWLNDRFVWLTGYSQRAANDWPGLGGAYPDWMHDFTPRSCARAMAITSAGCTSPPSGRTSRPATNMASSKSARPATRNGMVIGRQWDQRVEVMRDSMIYFRNNPSILFWEAGNTDRDARTRWSRWWTCASNGTPTAAASWAPGTMIRRRPTRPDPGVGVLRRHDRPGAADREDRRR